MAIIQVLTLQGNTNRTVLKDYQGEIYKGYGIVHWLSAGRKSYFAIHLKTGRIIGILSGGTSSDTIKGKIDCAKKHINPSMEYDEIKETLSEKL
ncbi:MAG: hypothetical protein K0R54_1820 [Clostridiaceae bacterium]|jgi:hypothetical protein|nr:hypothetical protein [Clostridiaceae bacterium]